MLKQQGAQRFSAKVYKLGINPCVDVPQRVSQAFGRRSYVPISGTLNGHLIRATLVPKGGGRHRLFLNGDMRKRASVDVGNRVDLVVDVDNAPRAVLMPKEFALALQKNRKAKTAFERLTLSRQKEILTYLNWIKRPETLKRNVEKIVGRLLKPAE
jgi:hypothetical protein